MSDFGMTNIGGPAYDSHVPIERKIEKSQKSNYEMVGSNELAVNLSTLAKMVQFYFDRELMAKKVAVRSIRIVQEGGGFTVKVIFTEPE